MAKRIGKHTIKLDSKPTIIASAGIVSQKEGEGPLGSDFDQVLSENQIGGESWEQAESNLLKSAIELTIKKSKLKNEQINGIFSGDLINQCTGSSFAVRDLNIPLCGVYGACSTMALSLICASLAIESGGFENCISATSSHFCSAERQFRKPLEYAGQRPPTSQWTVTGAGAMALSSNNKENLPYIKHVHFGTIQDLSITDANNMGAAMAPAARKTIADFLNDTNTSASDYDLILTGDLGYVGSTLLKQLLIKQDKFDITNVYNDCGLMIYDRKSQDVHAGGSGCGCSASVLCSHIMKRILDGELNNVLFVATGALLSTNSTLQGQSIPSIAHAINIVGGKR